MGVFFFYIKYLFWSRIAYYLKLDCLFGTIRGVFTHFPILYLKRLVQILVFMLFYVKIYLNLLLNYII